MLRIVVLLMLVAAPASADELATATNENASPSAVQSSTAPGSEVTDTRRWEVRLGAGIGGARMALLGQTHGGIGVTIDGEALRWFHRVGVGLYLTELVAVPLAGVMSTRGRPVSRDLAWEVEPELALRRSTRLAPSLSLGWKTTGSAGIVVARTVEDCASPFSHHVCQNVLERSIELGATAGVGVFAHVGPLAIDLGARAQADTAGDAAIALQGSAGAVW